LAEQAADLKDQRGAVVDGLGDGLGDMVLEISLIIPIDFTKSIMAVCQNQRVISADTAGVLEKCREGLRF
jgi:hypothetical protein